MITPVYRWKNWDTQKLSNLQGHTASFVLDSSQAELRASRFMSCLVFFHATYKGLLAVSPSVFIFPSRTRLPQHDWGLCSQQWWPWEALCFLYRFRPCLLIQPSYFLQVPSNCWVLGSPTIQWRQWSRSERVLWNMGSTRYYAHKEFCGPMGNAIYLIPLLDTHNECLCAKDSEKPVGGDNW